jgi:hypothetical protein
MIVVCGAKGNRVGRLLAALSYIGLTGALIPLAQPDNLFVVRHARRALAIHLLRVLLIAPVLAIPLLDPAGGRSSETMLDFARHLSLLVLVGSPGLDALSGSSGLWILGALILTWGLQFLGLLLASTGLTADMHAFLHADWPNYNGVDRRRHARGRRHDDPPMPSADEQDYKASVVRQREERLARVRAADSVAASERQRGRSLAELQEEFDRVGARRAHLNTLLELGEMSERRWGENSRQLDTRQRELATEIAILGARRLAVAEPDGRTWRDVPTDVYAQVPLQTLAISARSGVPLLTYGTFHLDEALVTGILSAFNSLSEEVFGAQVHKTQLAEGQVLYFVHAHLTITMAVFGEDPSPAQLRTLRDLVDEFERANAQELARSSPDPDRLREVAIPFAFVPAVAS